MAVTGCARNPPQHDFNPAPGEVRTAPARVPANPRKYTGQTRYVEPRIRRPALALLTPQPAPDCEFKRSDLKTADPDEWARLKVEFERQCFQDAEKVARDRLSLLQAASTCEIEPVPRKSAQPRQAD